MLQRIGDVAADDPPRQSFHDCRFTDTRIADQHRIVFGATRKDLHDAADLIVASDHRIDFSAPRQLRQIAAVFLERLIFAFGILIGHALRTAHLLQRLHQFVARDPEIFQQFCRGNPLCGTPASARR